MKKICFQSFLLQTLGWQAGSKAPGVWAPGLQLQLLGVGSCQLHCSQLRERDIDTGSAFQILSIRLVMETVSRQTARASSYVLFLELKRVVDWRRLADLGRRGVGQRGLEGREGRGVPGVPD